MNKMAAQLPEEARDGALILSRIMTGECSVFTPSPPALLQLRLQLGRAGSGPRNVGGGDDATLGLAWLLKASLPISSSFFLLP